MKNKTLLTAGIAVLVVVILFLGVSITGWVVKKVEYNDLCKEDVDCPENQCCLIYEDKNLGVCMEQCQSFEFLCKSDEECEEGTVCCVSEGIDYGICNYQDRCLSIDLFAEYIGKTTFLDKSEMLSPEEPERDVKDIIILREGILIIAFIIFTSWLLSKKGKKI